MGLRSNDNYEKSVCGEEGEGCHNNDDDDADDKMQMEVLVKIVGKIWSDPRLSSTARDKLYK